MADSVVLFRTMHTCCKYFIVLLCLVITLGECILPNYSAKNCTKLEMYKVKELISIEYECFSLEKQCKGWFYRERCENVLKKKTCTYHEEIEIIQYRNISVCCPGYMDVGNVTHCAKGCAIGYHGMQCDQECKCPVNAFKECNMYTGACTCKEGWMGEDCDEPCKEGFFGQGCTMMCICKNNSTCNTVTGYCDCSTSPGWTGTYCENVCVSGSYGVNCASKCGCGKNTDCNPVDGSCTCVAGFQGEKCDKECTNLTYGVDCKNDCKCIAANTEECSPVTGECSCRSGYYGEHCAAVCNHGYYGKGCIKICNCSAHEMCNPFDGMCVSKCLCKRNGTANCKNETCPCPSNTEDINTNDNVTDEMRGISNFSSCCTPETVMCECNYGWTGDFCQDVCRPGTFGQKCQTLCNCPDSAPCHHVTGECPELDRQTSGPFVIPPGRLVDDHSTTTALAVGLSVPLIIIAILLVLLLLFCIKTGKINKLCMKDFRNGVRTKFQETTRRIRKKISGGTYHEAHFESTREGENGPYHKLERDYKKAGNQTVAGGSMYDHAFESGYRTTSHSVIDQQVDDYGYSRSTDLHR